MEFLSQPSLVVALVEVAIGVWLLAVAADKFVDGAAGVAVQLRMSPVVIGAVVIGFGTSAPELLVSSLAAASGDIGLGVGNVVGSNVANLTLVLGAAALLVSLRVTGSVLAREAPLSLLSVLLFAYLTLGGLARWEGVVLVVVLVAAMGWIVTAGRVDPSLNQVDVDSSGPLGADAFTTVVGLVGTVIGAQLLIWGATSLAGSVGLTGGFVGFTLVATGTSLPELVTAVTAARKNETDLLLGNLLGSNMFNSLAVGGAIALVGPGPIVDRGLATVGVGCMVVVAVTAWVFKVARRKVFRLEAVILLSIWLVSVALMARNASSVYEQAHAGRVAAEQVDTAGTDLVGSAPGETGPVDDKV